MGQLFSTTSTVIPPSLGKTVAIISDTHGHHRRLDVPEADILYARTPEQHAQWSRISSSSLA